MHFRPSLRRNETDSTVPKRHAFSVVTFRSKGKAPIPGAAKSTESSSNVSLGMLNGPAPPLLRSGTSSSLAGSSISRQDTLVDISPLDSSAPRWKHPQVRMTFKFLRALLAKQNQKSQAAIDEEDLFAGKLWSHDVENEKGPRKQQVLGNRLDEITKIPFVSSTVVLFGYQHIVPTILLACTERLRKSGQGLPGLFEIAADRERLVHIVQRYNELLPARSLPDLTYENAKDVAVLLKLYIDALPHPLVHCQIQESLWLWCVLPSVKRKQLHSHEFRPRMVQDEDGGMRSASDDSDHASDIEVNAVGLPSFHSRKKREARKATEERRRARAEFKKRDPETYYAKHAQVKKERESNRVQLDEYLRAQDQPQVSIARFLLMLLPSEAFSFVLCLFDFLSSFENRSGSPRLSYEELGVLFGFKIFGGSNPDASAKTMTWILERWAWLSRGFMSPAALEKAKSQAYPEKSQLSKQGSSGTLFDQNQQTKDPESFLSGADGKIVGRRRSSSTSALDEVVYKEKARVEHLSPSIRHLDAVSSLKRSKCASPATEDRVSAPGHVTPLRTGCTHCTKSFTIQPICKEGRKTSMSYRDLKEGDYNFDVGIL